MNLKIGTRVRLNNGVEMPLFGLGTWDARGREAGQAVLWALEAGYRLIDTAKSYDNEQVVGEAIRASGVPREEIFVTTKLWPDELGYDSALLAFEESRRRLGLERIDLYLIHWPGDDARLREETWRALETLLADGKCRSIGVSNYEVEHLREIVDSGRTIPAVNQMKFSPFLQQRAVHEFGRARGIRLEAYSPLTRGRRLGDPGLRKLAEAYGRTVAQILLRWTIQKDVIVIPKSGHRERILENAAIFDFSLSSKDMKTLDGLDEELR